MSTLATRTADRATARARRGARLGTPLLGVLAWIAGIGFFFPVLWMFLTGFKQEADAFTRPPKLLFAPTLEQYRQIFTRSFAPFLINSASATIISTLLVLLLALPCAYGLAIKPVEKWRDVLFFFLSTRFLPVVGAIVPIYIIARNAQLLDTVTALIILYTAMNMPIAVWMLRSFFLEVPREIMEAARVDGATLRTEIMRIVLPLIAPGIAATALICVIFAWNEFFFAVNLTSSRAATVPVFLVGFITSEGLFWARLSAAATMACLPVLLAGWIAQKQLVRGLTMGAVK
ncbi:MAG TPA: carbohydrate ABC transporter permease [Actinomycetes bacterium]|jgi:sorbitol/mannitol transport system permease protein|nr:carbohydrate ABC transporter permease [Actinomycetes bacterium]